MEVYLTGRVTHAQFSLADRSGAQNSSKESGDSLDSQPKYQAALAGSFYGSICPHIPRIHHASGAHSVDAVVGKTQGLRTTEQCFSPQQECLLSAFSIVTVNRVGRDMDGPSSAPF